MPKNTKATLTLNLIYSGKDATHEVIEGILDELVQFAASRGHFTDETHDLTVEQWSHTTDVDVWEVPEDDLMAKMNPEEDPGPSGPPVIPTRVEGLPAEDYPPAPTPKKDE